MTQSSTDRSRYSFKVSEGGTDKDTWYVFISCEPMGPGVDLFRDGLLSFDLPKGTSIERAEEIAEFLDENISAIAYTFISSGAQSRKKEGGEA